MESNKNKRVTVSRYILALYCFIIVLVAAWSLNRPAYNWDMLPYMGVVLSYDHADDAYIHQTVYATAKSQVPAVFYNRMIDPSNTYRNSAAKNVAVFQSQLPFYIVKPLYTLSAWLFYRAGIQLATATVWPSVIAYVLTGLLLFYWIHKYHGDGYAFACSTLIMVSPPLLNVAGLSSPDALSGLLLFTVVFWLTEKRSAAGACIFLLLAIAARLDNIIPAMIFSATFFFSAKWGYRLSFFTAVSFLLVPLIVFFIVSAQAGPYGWGIFYYPAFVKQLNSAYTINSSFNWKEYAVLAKSQLVTGLYFSFVSVFLLFVWLFLRQAPLPVIMKLMPEQMLAVLFVLVIVIRFLLQPLVNDRIYIPYYLSIAVFSINKNSKLLQPVSIN